MLNVQEEKKEKLIECIQANKEKMYRIAYQYLKNEEIALDCVQDTIEKAFKKIDTLREEKYLKTWVYRILINQCCTNLKKNRKTLVSIWEKQEIQEEQDITQTIAIEQMINDLKPKLKNVIVLRFFEEMKLEEIAQVTHTNVSTVKSRLYKALQELKIKMGEF